MPDLIEMTIPANIRLQMVSGGMPADFRAYKMGPCRVLHSEDIIGQSSNPRQHLSISCADRLPTWAEMGQIKDTLCPNVFMCVPHPPREFWLNIHDYCLHLWEFRDEPLREQMVEEGERAAQMGFGEHS